jgi:hypothetical protein
MGHCGNRGNPQPGDNVLSYRTPNANGSWTPHLTFVLMKDGYLSEMKGRGNDKPAEKYHTIIEKLIMSDHVKGITGGGYKPENNFSIFDLPKAQYTALTDKKPTLITLDDCVRLYLETKSATYKSRIVKSLKKAGVVLKKESGTVKVLVDNLRDSFKVDTDPFIFNVKSFARLFSLRQLDDWVSFVPKADPKYYDANRAFGLLRMLRERDVAVYSTLCNVLDTYDTAEIESMITDGSHSNLLRACQFAFLAGKRVGTKKNIDDAVFNCLKQNDAEWDGDEKSLNVWMSFDNIVLILNTLASDGVALSAWLDKKETFFEYLSNFENVPNIIKYAGIQAVDLVVPTFGFGFEYDEDAAYDSFLKALKLMKVL